MSNDQNPPDAEVDVAGDEAIEGGRAEVADHHPEPDGHAEVAGSEAESGGQADNPEKGAGSETVAINKPRAASATAQYAPTTHSKPVEERLADLRKDLLVERRHRRLLLANTVMAVLGVMVIGGEVSAIATGLVLVQHRQVAVAIVFAISSGVTLAGVVLAFARFGDTTGQTNRERFWCRTLLSLGALIGVVGAFIAAWPMTMSGS